MDFNLKQMGDAELLVRTKQLVQQERELLTEILHHLREVDRRKLFSELNCRSLFDYCVKILRYSEGKARRRIQALRLVEELPEIEEKITSGALNLSNLSKAQDCFYGAKKNNKTITSDDKLEILKKLENKSSREGQAILMELQPIEALPKEFTQWITPDLQKVNLVLSAEIVAKLEEVRALLGTAGSNMELSELISKMATLSCESLKIKKFGKKRVISQNNTNNPLSAISNHSKSTSLNELKTNPKLNFNKNRSKNGRHISKEIKFQVWQRDNGKCTKCGSSRHLNYDHIKPYALNGDSSLGNLRLLCFHCNQRQAIKTFGMEKCMQ